MELRELFHRWQWLCPLLGVVAAAAVLLLFGLSPWSAILAALFLVCPVLVLWGLWHARRHP